MENIKKALLILAIAILFFAFILYAKESIYPTPRYNDYCDYDLRPTPIINHSNETECIQAGGEWIKQEYCSFNNTQNKCYEEYNQAREKNQRYSFYIFLPMAIITIVISLVYIKTGTIAVGFLIGGILLLIYSILSYWQNFPDIIKTLLLGIALAILVYIAYKKFNK